MLYLQSRATELVTDNDLGPDWLLELETKVQVLKIFTITEKVSPLQLDPNFMSTYHGLMLV